ncbi:MAG: diaminopimelate epimerase [Thermodesulfobacteriota bacterium]
MSFFSRETIPFYKMQGSGNDFVLLVKDHLPQEPRDMSHWAKCICTRAFAVGADGLIFLQSTPGDPDLDIKWDFYNSDGSRAEMCGNGSRCAAALAYALNMAPLELAIGTDAGPVRAKVLSENSEVQVQLTQPFNLNNHVDLKLSDGTAINIHYVNMGVPHAVVISDDANKVDIKFIGPEIRYHSHFSPQGANVNIIQKMDSGHIYVRTYERGVEAETYACGTGAAASAFIAHNLGLCGEETKITTSGGEELRIILHNGSVYLQGKANLVYKGELNPRAIGL